MLKKIIPLITIFILIISLCGCSPKVINKEEMIGAQISFSEKVSPLMSDMATSYGAYLAYDKSESAFKEDVAAYKKRYRDIESSYQKFNQEYKLDPSLANENTTKAINAIELARKSIGNILDGTIKDDKVISRTELVNLYVDQTKKANDNLKIFKDYINK